jgi:HNH endonuclease
MTEQQFWDKVDASGDCWEWTGTLSHGYGSLWVPGRIHVFAHRYAYELLVGPIPKGLQIDHRCRNLICVNPDHLEVVTISQNVLRGYSVQAMHARQTHCKRGHPFDEANTYLVKGGGRICRRCHADRQDGYRKADPEKYATINAVYAASHREQILAQKRAKRSRAA